MLLIYGDEISYPFIMGIIAQAMKNGSLCDNQDSLWNVRRVLNVAHPKNKTFPKSTRIFRGRNKRGAGR